MSSAGDFGKLGDLDLLLVLLQRSMYLHTSIGWFPRQLFAALNCPADAVAVIDSPRCTHVIARTGEYARAITLQDPESKADIDWHTPRDALLSHPWGVACALPDGLAEAAPPAMAAAAQPVRFVEPCCTWVYVGKKLAITSKSDGLSPDGMPRMTPQQQLLLPPPSEDPPAPSLPRGYTLDRLQPHPALEVDGEGRPVPGPDALAVAAAWKYSGPGTAAAMEARLRGRGEGERGGVALTVCVRFLEELHLDGESGVESIAGKAPDPGAACAGEPPPSSSSSRLAVSTSAAVAPAVGWFIRRPDGSLGQLHVLEAHRRKGLARALVREGTRRVLGVERGRSNALRGLQEMVKVAAEMGGGASPSSAAAMSSGTGESIEGKVAAYWLAGEADPASGARERGALEGEEGSPVDGEGGSKHA